MVIQIKSTVNEEAIIAGKNLCDWLSNPNSLYNPPVGHDTKLKLESIKAQYGNNTTCLIKRSNFNESIFETSIFVSSSNKDILGLRFGLQTNFYKQSALIGFLGFWTPWQK
ncbi:MAG: hypothetical protein GY941_15375 [Planctomycetes bacterium]|nr:hypothetical protein [Planctomycetota bacterium]